MFDYACSTVHNRVAQQQALEVNDVVVTGILPTIVDADLALVIGGRKSFRERAANRLEEAALRVIFPIGGAIARDQDRSVRRYSRGGRG